MPLNDPNQLSTATTPLVREDGTGGHAPVTALADDTTEALTASNPTFADLLTAQVTVLNQILAEITAARNAIDAMATAFGVAVPFAVNPNG